MFAPLWYGQGNRCSFAVCAVGRGVEAMSNSPADESSNVPEIPGPALVPEEFESRPQTKPPPGAWEPARQAARALVRPLESFMKIQAASGILLLVMALVAMLWANSPWRESYHHLWHIPLTLGLGDLVFTRDLHFWINDGLMVIFFFVVGLEIRRELHHGELSEFKRAALPVAAALGGMLVPALIYLSLNSGPATRHGWGVPMATDIAFAVGILALLGPRVPAALRVLLLALAIIDDIGAILVIALFYSSGVNVVGLVIAALGVLLVIGLQRVGVRQPLIYVLPGAVLWAGMLNAGVHPTIAGVILGLLTPARSWYGQRGFLAEAKAALDEFSDRTYRKRADSHDLIEPLNRIETAQREAIPPVVRLESMLNPWVAFVIMPLFALSNAGVTVRLDALSTPGAGAVALGVALGLSLGKPIGIVSVSLLAAKLNVCALPRGVNLRGLLVVGTVGGIGFTMALFIAQLAFTDPTRLGIAKIAVLLGSFMAGILGILAGTLLLPKHVGVGVAETVDEAEQSTEL